MVTTLFGEAACVRSMSIEMCERCTGLPVLKVYNYRISRIITIIQFYVVISRAVLDRLWGFFPCS